MFGTFVLMFVCFHLAGGPTALTERAADAINSGIVHNTAAINRAIPDMSDLSEKEKIRVTQALLEAGAISASEDNTFFLWNNNTTAYDQLMAQIENDSANGNLRDLLKPVWEKSFLISGHLIQDHDTVNRLVASGFLTNVSSDPLAKTYRITDVILSDSAMLAKLDELSISTKGNFMAVWRKDRVVTPIKLTSFLPPFDLKGGGLLAVWSIIVFLGLQWWAGGEGGGFLAQRLFSCKNEKESVLAMLWFNFANFVLRPWPWIVVGIASLFIIPDITAYGSGYDAEHAYVIMLMKCLPSGIKGLLVASLMAAYMSTISTHVNFGASYVINDIYKRFINRKASERHTILLSQIISVLLAVLAGIYAYASESVSDGWFLMFELMSGVGFVVLLRWYWSRISAWSEIAAMISSLVMYAILNWTPVFATIFGWIGLPEYLVNEYPVRFTLNMFCTTVIWVTVTFRTPPEKEEILVRFFKRIRPAGAWRAIAAKAGIDHCIHVGKLEWACWALGVASLFTMIFCVGNLCFGRYLASLSYGIFATISTTAIFYLMKKMDWTSLNTEEPHPTLTPPLDPDFVAPSLFIRDYNAKIQKVEKPVHLLLALERQDGQISRFGFNLLPITESTRDETCFLAERLLKFMLWSRGGFKVYISAPDEIVSYIQTCYSLEGARAFDCEMIQRTYGHPLEIISCYAEELPAANEKPRRLGRHVKGCRIGFDLGASDYKLASVQDGKALFTTEIPWDPKPEADPDFTTIKSAKDSEKLPDTYLASMPSAAVLPESTSIMNRSWHRSSAPFLKTTSSKK